MSVRHHWGILLIAAVVLSAAVIPRLTAIPIAGSPLAAPAADQPTTGQCLVDSPSDQVSIDVRGVDGLSSPSTGPCTDWHFGELVTVVADGSQFPHSVVNQLSAVDVGFCYRTRQSYFGLQENSSGGGPGATDVGFSVWNPIQRGQVVLIGPSNRQRQLGQRWVGCAVYSDSGPYRGSVAHSFDGGQLPSAFGACRHDIGERPTVSCIERHRVELIGTASLAGSQIDQKALNESCAAMGRTLTRMPDITGRGRLSLAAYIFHTDSSGHREFGAPPGSAKDRLAFTVCSIQMVGPGFLRGTLIGLSGAPVPFG